MKGSVIVLTLIFFIMASVNSSAFNFVSKFENGEINIIEIESLDNYIEIITTIEGMINGFKFKRIGIGLNIEIWAYDRTIDLSGWRINYPIFPIRNWSFSEDAKHVLIPNFIGYIGPPCDQSGSRGINGIAIGNIEWE